MSDAFIFWLCGSVVLLFIKDVRSFIWVLVEKCYEFLKAFFVGLFELLKFLIGVGFAFLILLAIIKTLKWMWTV